MAGERVLCISYDRTLGKIRELILEQAGYTVRSVVGNQAGMLAAETDCFDIFIVGNTARREVREQMAGWLKQRFPSTPVIALKRWEYESPITEADCVTATVDPAEWLKIVCECLAAH
jgi:hypothetical protein